MKLLYIILIAGLCFAGDKVVFVKDPGGVCVILTDFFGIQYKECGTVVSYDKRFIYITKRNGPPNTYPIRNIKSIKLEDK